MGGSELKKALQHEVADRCKEFWSDQEQVVNERRKEIEREVATLDDQVRQQQKAACEHLQSELLARAERQAAHLRLQAEAELAKRLRHLATQQVMRLYQADRASYWERLANELPQATWEEILVAELDVEQAAQFFGEVSIRLSPKLSGGLIALREKGRIRIDNSLQIRVDRYWPTLLPRLLAQLRTMVKGDATP